MSISIKKPADIEKLKIANNHVAQTLEYLKTLIQPGITLNELNRAGEDFITKKLKSRPSFKGLYGFPAGVCTSLNEIVIHGIPNDTVLKEGDIIGLDIGVEYQGWYGDAAITTGVGKIAKIDQKLIDCSYQTLINAIDQIKVGMRFKELSLILEQEIKSKGFVPLHSFCGHGIGTKPHEAPEIPNYLEHGSPKTGPKIKNGMVFCLEPMVCQKSSIPKILENKWDVISEDNLNTSHYEHTVAIIDNKAQILSVI